MSNKRLLFIHDDSSLGDIYRDCLESAGFVVESAQTGEAGVRMAEQLHPDAVLVDPILESDGIGDALAQIRLKKPASQLPIIILPTQHAPLVNEVMRAGATQRIEKSGTPLSSIIAAVNAALGTGQSTEIANNISNAFIKQAQSAALTAAPESLTSMRQALHEIIASNQGADSHWRELLRRTHTFAGLALLPGENPASHVAASLEVLLYGMMCYPERINPLTLRTLGQAVDFLSTLWEREMHLQPLDLQNSHVLIVEDEPSARDLIVAAMQMVGLNADGLETPGASLAVLSTQPFDLIFMDVNLPEMNGFEVCKKLRALSLHERTPVIFLTGMASFQNRAQSSLCGGNDFVGKPFNLAELGVKALIWLFKGRLGLS